MNFIKKVRKSLRIKLILVSVVVEVVMLTVLLSNSIRIINNTISEQNKLHIELINPLLSASLSNSLFARDYVSINAIIKSLLKSTRNNFIYILVYDDQGKLYAKAGDTEAYHHQDIVGDLANVVNSKIIHVSSPLVLETRQLGEVRYGLSNASLVASKYSLLQQGLIIAVIEIILTILLLGLAGYFLTRHLYALIDGMTSVQQGKYNATINIESDDEIGRLADGFNQMQQAVRDRIVALENEKQRKQVTLGSIADAVITTDANAIIDYLNPVAETLLNCKLAECEGKPVSSFFNINGDDSEPMSECLKRNKVIRSTIQTKLLNSFTLPFPVEYIAAPIREKGIVVGVVCAFRDISNRIERDNKLNEYRDSLEHMVAERTRELESTNRELESFSYSISHDLRSPLRSLDGFSSVLLEDYHDQLDEAGKNYLNRIRKAAQKMGQLIDDLLNLSRMGRGEVNKQQINLSNLAEEILTQLKEEQPQRSVQIEIENGLMVYADKNLMTIAFENLISNAWKYTSKIENAIIVIGAKTESNTKIFYIKDNGAGFDSNNSQKLFSAFQRMHLESEFSGTGIGLAIVQRIIHRHGGKIWVESQINQGAAFYFSLPDKVASATSA